MNFADGSRIMNAALQVMKTLGWAWRWAEWWVDYSSTWEPLLEPGQKESRMTKRELKIVDSTRESRCSDARKCRLAAFGAALRNRDYDTPNGFNLEAFDIAIRAVLHTRSLVGPLEEYEINFFADWLGRAYRSKSRLLGFGDDKIKVAEKSHVVLHIQDQSQKYMLGNRLLPGSGALEEDGIFEADVKEVDDFMLREPVVIQRKSAKRAVQPKSPRPRPRPITTDAFEKAEAERKRLRNEKDRVRRERKLLELEQQNVVSAKRSERTAKQSSDTADKSGNEIASTAVKSRERPRRDRGVAILSVPGQEKRGPGRPRKRVVPVEQTNIKRLNQVTRETDSDEDYEDEVGLSPAKRKRGLPSKDKSNVSGIPDLGRRHNTDRRKRQRYLTEDFAVSGDHIDVGDVDREQPLSTNVDAAGVAKNDNEESNDSASVSRSPRRRNDCSPSKFDLVKIRQRQTRSTINVGSGSASKTYDAPMMPGGARKKRSEDSDDDGLPIAKLVLKRRDRVGTPPIPPAPHNLLETASSEISQEAQESTNPETAGPLTNEGSHAAKRNARSVNSEDTPQKRGRRRGKQQAVDQLSLTLSQIKQQRRKKGH